MKGEQEEGTQVERWSGYLDDLASKAPVPGGGGTAALCGALGAALGEMVGNLTAGKKKYAEWEPQTQENLARLSALRARFVELAEEDERVFEPLSKAYGIRAETEEEKKQKAEYLEKCLAAAAAVPVSVMETCLEALGPVEFFAEYGSRLAVSDAGVGAQLLRAALLGAAMNVYINTRLMKDRNAAESLELAAARLTEEGTRRADRVYECVLEGLKG